MAKASRPILSPPSSNVQITPSSMISDVASQIDDLSKSILKNKATQDFMQEQQQAKSLADKAAVEKKWGDSYAQMHNSILGGFFDNPELIKTFQARHQELVDQTTKSAALIAYQAGDAAVGNFEQKTATAQAVFKRYLDNAGLSGTPYEMEANNAYNTIVAPRLRAKSIAQNLVLTTTLSIQHGDGNTREVMKEALDNKALTDDYNKIQNEQILSLAKNGATNGLTPSQNIHRINTFIVQNSLARIQKMPDGSDGNANLNEIVANPYMSDTGQKWSKELGIKNADQYDLLQKKCRLLKKNNTNMNAVNEDEALTGIQDENSWLDFNLDPKNIKLNSTSSFVSKSVNKITATHDGFTQLQNINQNQLSTAIDPQRGVVDNKKLNDIFKANGMDKYSELLTRGTNAQVQGIDNIALQIYKNRKKKLDKGDTMLAYVDIRKYNTVKFQPNALVNLNQEINANSIANNGKITSDYLSKADRDNIANGIRAYNPNTTELILRYKNSNPTADFSVQYNERGNYDVGSIVSLVGTDSYLIPPINIALQEQIGDSNSEGYNTAIKINDGSDKTAIPELDNIKVPTLFVLNGIKTDNTANTLGNAEHPSKVAQAVGIIKNVTGSEWYSHQTSGYHLIGIGTDSKLAKLDVMFENKSKNLLKAIVMNGASHLMYIPKPSTSTVQVENPDGQTITIPTQQFLNQTDNYVMNWINHTGHSLYTKTQAYNTSTVKQIGNKYYIYNQVSNAWTQISYTKSTDNKK